MTTCLLLLNQFVANIDLNLLFRTVSYDFPGFLDPPGFPGVRSQKVQGSGRNLEKVRESEPSCTSSGQGYRIISVEGVFELLSAMVIHRPSLNGSTTGINISFRVRHHPSMAGRMATVLIDFVFFVGGNEMDDD